MWLLLRYGLHLPSGKWRPHRQWGPCAHAKVYIYIYIDVRGTQRSGEGAFEYLFWQQRCRQSKFPCIAKEPLAEIRFVQSVISTTLGKNKSIII